MSTPLLSILMPTRNRLECACHAIRNILRMHDDNFELVVHDNSDNKSLATRLEAQACDSRLRYTWNQGRLSISENFERAISQATGTFVCILGDDDGVSPWVAALASWMQANNLDAVSSTFPIQYYWPGVKSEDYGHLILRPFNASIKPSNPQRELLKCVKSGGTLPFDLPRVYHGVVRRDCLEEVRNKTGHYAPGVSPDMAASIALASVVERSCRIDYPLFVPGASPSSGAGRGVNKTHHGRLSEESFLDQRFVATWPDGVPPFFSGPTMWSAATVQALMATGRLDVLQHFNQSALHAACAVFVSSHKSQILASFCDTLPVGQVGRSLQWTKFAGNYLRQNLRRAWRLSMRLSTTKLTGETNPLSNIDDAMVFLKQSLVNIPPPMLDSTTRNGLSELPPLPHRRADFSDKSACPRELVSRHAPHSQGL